MIGDLPDRDILDRVGRLLEEERRLAAIAASTPMGASAASTARSTASSTCNAPMIRQHPAAPDPVPRPCSAQAESSRRHAPPRRRGSGRATAFALNHAQAETDIFAISAAFGRLSTFQQASMTRRIMGAGMMPSARSENFVSSCWSVIGISTLPIACSIVRCN